MKLIDKILLFFKLKRIDNCPKIVWQYQYLQGCRVIQDNEGIDTTPDKQNRWQVKGFLYVNTNVIPTHKAFGNNILVKLATIEQNVINDKLTFSCKFTDIYNPTFGYSYNTITYDTPREVMDKVEEEFNKMYKYFLYAE